MKIYLEELQEKLESSLTLEEISYDLHQLGHENEILEDYIDIDITPNRGDCLSVKGILRELNVFHATKISDRKSERKIEPFNFDFKNLVTDACPRISFVKLKIGDVPKKYKPYLERYIINHQNKSINFFTDISNYLSHRYGHPTHCYDFKKIDGELILEKNKKLRAFQSLNNEELEVKEGDLVFTMGDRIVNLAGVMGGLDTSCSQNTKEVLIECAFFKPESVIGVAKKYNINSEAAYKFERGVDPNTTEKTIRKFIDIVDEHTNIIEVEIFSDNRKEFPVRNINLDIELINKIIGFNKDKKEIEEILNRLGFECNEGNIIVPSYRSDIETINDVAEELARVVGYDNIPKNEFSLPAVERKISKEEKLIEYLCDNGFYEVINFPFENEKKDGSIKVLNPLDSNKRFIRTSMITSLKENLIFNEKRQKDSIKFFEISNLYYSKGQNLLSNRKIALIVSGRVGMNYMEYTKFFQKHYLQEILSRYVEEKYLEIIEIPRDQIDSKLKAPIHFCEISLANISSKIFSYVSQKKVSKKDFTYKKPSQFPSSSRDLSFLVNSDTSAKKLITELSNFSHEYLKETFIFDYYKNEKDNKIKIGYKFIFQSHSKTLEVSEVDRIIDDIVKLSTGINGIDLPGYKYVNNE